MRPFRGRTNVQFLQILDRKNLRIEIWERGAGYTLASGSSACAAANAAFRLGLCEAATQVHTPGGILQVAIAPDGENFNRSGGKSQRRELLAAIQPDLNGLRQSRLD